MNLHTKLYGKMRPHLHRVREIERVTAMSVLHCSLCSANKSQSNLTFRTEDRERECEQVKEISECVFPQSATHCTTFASLFEINIPNYVLGC